MRGGSVGWLVGWLVDLVSWLAIVVGLVGIGWFAGWLLLRLVRLMRQVRLVDFGATVLHFLVNEKKSISAFTANHI